MMADTVELFGCYVTRKAGPAREDGGSRILVEVTAAAEDQAGPYPIELTLEQAVSLGVAIIQAAR